MEAAEGGVARQHKGRTILGEILETSRPCAFDAHSRHGTEREDLYYVTPLTSSEKGASGWRPPKEGWQGNTRGRSSWEILETSRPCAFSAPSRHGTGTWSGRRIMPIGTDANNEEKSLNYVTPLTSFEKGGHLRGGSKPGVVVGLSLIHISEPTRLESKSRIPSYA